MTKKNNLNSNVQDHNGIRISYHEKVCAERMKTLFNQSGHTFIYMAFAEQPFVTSTGVPATAR